MVNLRRLNLNGWFWHSSVSRESPTAWSDLRTLLTAFCMNNMEQIHIV